MRRDHDDHGRLIEAAFPRSSTHPFFKIVIDPQMKQEALRTLMRMNITASSLFPGLDGLGRSIRELIKLEVPFTDPF